MNEKLFLDDKRTPPKGWDHVSNYKEFTEYLEQNPMPSVVSFDHDLHEEHYDPLMYDENGKYDELYKTFKHNTGLDCADYLFNKCYEEGIKVPEIIIHSKNPRGRFNISSLFIARGVFYYGEAIPSKIEIHE